MSETTRSDTRSAPAVAAALLAIVGVGGEAAAQLTTLIDFELNAPTVFASTGPLRDAYAAQGLLFSGPSDADGAAVLNQGGNFGIDARSGDEFLAFNHGSSMQNGGVPRGPETILFDPPARRVSIWVAGGSGSGAAFRMDAFIGATAVDTSSTSAQTSWVQLVVESPNGIDRVVLEQIGGDVVYVMDDLEVVSLDAALVSSATEISIATGGVQDLTLFAGEEHAGRLYLVLGSVTGNGPLTIDDQDLPLSVDIYTVHTLMNPNAPPLTGSLGVLDGSGVANALFTVPGGLTPSFVGVTFYHACAIVSLPPEVIVVREVSNPVELTLLP